MEKELLEKIESQTKSQLEKAIEKMANKEEISNLMTKLEEVKSLNETELTELKEIAKAQGEWINEQRAKGSNVNGTLEKFLIDHKSELESSAKGREFGFTLKTDVDTTIVSSSTQGYRDMKIGQLPLRTPVIESLFSSIELGQNNNGILRYMDMDTYTSNAAGVSEKGVVPQDAVTYVERSAGVVKIGTSIPITEEFMYKQNLLVAEIQNRLLAEMNVKVDTALITGNGTPPNIKGLNEYAPEWALGSLSKVKAANLYDLILGIATQIASENNTGSAGTKFQANTVLVNDYDFYGMISAKDSLEQYLKPTFVSPDYMMIAGVKVVKTQAITANTMIVGDFNFGTILKEGGIDIKTGYNLSQDFIKGILTLRAVRNLNLLVRNSDLNAFRKVSSITSAIDTLKAPGN